VFYLKNKTPISILQELCTKWGIIPQYKFVARDGPVHDPVFEYCVVAGEHSASGKGKLNLFCALFGSQPEVASWYRCICVFVDRCAP
jgi:hypothetical protein